MASPLAVQVFSLLCFSFAPPTQKRRISLAAIHGIFVASA
jgi:hypothetical protein